MKEVTLNNPGNLEVKSKHADAKNLTTITIAVYSPPRSWKKSQLLDFISSTYYALKVKYPDVFLLF